MTAPGEAASPQHRAWWRAVVVLLVIVLAGLPSESSRDLALAQDWHFDPIDQDVAALLGARKSVAEQSDTGHGSASEASNRDGDTPDGMVPGASVPAPPAASLHISWRGAPDSAQPAGLLPYSTGPPRA